MKKFILSIMLGLCLLFSFIFVGCDNGNPNYQNYTPVEGSRFFELESYIDPHLGYVKILVDKDTRIVYMLVHYSSGDSGRMAFSVLYDSNGSPKKYEGAISN